MEFVKNYSPDYIRNGEVYRYEGKHVRTYWRTSSRFLAGFAVLSPWIVLPLIVNQSLPLNDAINNIFRWPYLFTCTLSCMILWLSTGYGVANAAARIIFSVLIPTVLFVGIFMGELGEAVYQELTSHTSHALSVSSLLLAYFCFIAHIIRNGSSDFAHRDIWQRATENDED